MPLSWAPLSETAEGRPFGAVFSGTSVADVIASPALRDEMLEIVFGAGGMCVFDGQHGITAADEEAFYDLFPGTDRSDGDMSFPPTSPLALPERPMVHVMVTDSISLDNHPGSPGLSDSQARSDGYVKNGDTKGATGSSAIADKDGKLQNAIQVREFRSCCFVRRPPAFPLILRNFLNSLSNRTADQFHHDGNFWQSLPPAWTMLSCHERSGCSSMSQQTTADGPPIEFVGGDTLFASTDVSLLRGKLSGPEMEAVLGAKVIYQPRQVFGKQWSTEGPDGGHGIVMMENGIRPVHPPTWDPDAPDLAELSEGRGLPPSHSPEKLALHSEEGGQVFPLVRKHPVTGKGSVFVHTLCVSTQPILTTT